LDPKTTYEMRSLCRLVADAFPLARLEPRRAIPVPQRRELHRSERANESAQDLALADRPVGRYVESHGTNQ
jgi:hypothetical protein